MKFEVLHDNPVPVILGTCPAADNPPFQRPPAEPLNVTEDLGPCLFRAVNKDRLPTILRTGIDVQPCDAPLFAAGFDKAWEYGDFPKVMMALDLRHLQPSWTTLPTDASDAELADVRARYPTVLRRRDGQQLWCTRLGPDDPRAGSPYEAEYGYWIPGDPFDALAAVLLFVYSDEAEVGEALVRAAKARAVPSGRGPADPLGPCSVVEGSEPTKDKGSGLGCA